MKIEEEKKGLETTPTTPKLLGWPTGPWLWCSSTCVRYGIDGGSNRIPFPNAHNPNSAPPSMEASQ